MNGLFVTGTDTGAGKTVVAAAICAALRGTPFKPVVTGTDEPPASRPPARRPASLFRAALASSSLDWPPDHVLLGRAAGVDPERVSPARFGPPVSPHLAQELAGAPLHPVELVDAAREAGARGKPLVVEGVGGLLVPLTDAFTVRDFAVELGLPLVVAARPGLGTINHTLLTLEAARAAGLSVAAVVLTPWPAQPSVMERSNRATIARLGDVEVATLPRLRRADAGLLARAGLALPLQRWLGTVRVAA